MPSHDGQRRHIIHSLAALLYELHTVSFLLSPSIWIYICRVTSQFHFSRPRDLDPNRSLRFWFALVLFFNFGAVWSHAKEGATQGRSIILDFVGMSYVPSRIHLLFLDFSIIFLQMLLTTIAYETSLAADMPNDTPDPLLQEIPSHSSIPSTSTEQMFKCPEPTSTEIPYAVEVRFPLVLDRLRNPPPPPPPRDTSLQDLLPLPNTTPWQLSSGLQRLLRVRQQLRERARAAETAAGQARREEGTTGEEEEDDARQDIPGGLNTERGS